LEIVYTSKYDSWLNIAECELSVLSRQALKEQVQAWTAKRYDLQKGVDWQFITEDTRSNLKKLYPTILT